MEGERVGVGTSWNLMEFDPVPVLIPVRPGRWGKFETSPRGRRLLLLLLLAVVN